MNRYQQTFSALKKQNKMAFIPFWMIGDPDSDKSQEIIEKMAVTADILELGIPFSDPLADGKVLQDSANRAIESGITVQRCLNIVSNIRKKFPIKPIGLLVYLNLILQFGIEDFFINCQKSGVDSVLIPELPIEEVQLIEAFSKKYKIDLIFLVSTNTPQDRINLILKKSGGFLYAISTPGITGAKSSIDPKTLKMVQSLKAQTDLPICVGFGISSPEHLTLLKENKADGGIIGSKLFEFSANLNSMEIFCESCKKVC